MDSPDKPGYTIIPSAKASGVGAVDKSGLQANGFDPHSPQKQIIDPDSANPTEVTIWGTVKNKKVVDLPQSTDNKKPKGNKNSMAKQFSDPAEVKTPPAKSTKTIESEYETVYLHVPGAKVPFKVADYYVNTETKTLALIVSDAVMSSVPEFEVTDENSYVTLSDDKEIYFCAYMGQKIPLRTGLTVIVFIILKTQVKAPNASGS